MSSILMKIMASSVVIANRAGVVIRDIMETGNLGIVNKAEHGDPIDPQTQADRSAQDMIIGSLSKQYPGLCVVGEEECNGENVDKKLLVTDMDSDVLKHECPSEYQDLKMDDIVVWVDPLDGTKEFTEGHVTHVTILIGVCKRESNWWCDPSTVRVHQWQDIVGCSRLRDVWNDCGFSGTRSKNHHNN